MRKFGYRQLLMRTLRHHAATNFAILVGCFVGASALIGALFVGDSIRGSLRSLTMERLGDIDQAMVGSRFFMADLAKRISSTNEDSVETLVPAILIQAAVTNPETKITIRANIIGFDPTFWKLFPDSKLDVGGSDEAVINQPLADILDLKTGGRLLLKVEKPSPIPKESLLGDRSADRSLTAISLGVGKIIPAKGVGRFGLDASQRVPRNLFVPIAKLQKALDIEGRANALLAHERSGKTNFLSTEKPVKSLQLADYGLKVRVDSQFRYLSVESIRQVLEDSVVDAATEAAKSCELEAIPMLAYLANSIEHGERKVPYSVVVSAEGGFDKLPIESGIDPKLKAGEVFVNMWTAEQLRAKPGDSIRMEFYAPTDDGVLKTLAETFRLKGVAAMDGLALDKGFVPPVKGLTDAATFANWDTPFPVDLKKIRKIDEDYWKKYRTAPKVFLSRADGVRLWTTRFGKTTAVRVSVPANQSIADVAKSFESSLASRLDPAAFGFEFQQIRKLALDASAGSTDFGQLFVAFSFFLIVSAALLVGLLFRLNVERRANQVGLELAVGFSFATARWLLLIEGFLLAMFGAVAGIFGALAYARWMIAWLTTRWQSATGLPFIEFHGSMQSAVVGAMASIVVAMIAIYWAVNRLKSATVPRLMRSAFQFGDDRISKPTRWTGWLAAISTVAGLALVGLGATGHATVASFFGAGGMLLIAGLATVAHWTRRPRTGVLRGQGALAASRLAVRNAGRYPARTVLTASMVGFAAFLLVALGALSRQKNTAKLDKASGNGGFALLAETAAPVVPNLNTPDGRFQAGVSDDPPLLNQWTAFAFRTKPGDDASCLNIYQPKHPTLLAASADFIERGGFAFSSTLNPNVEEKANPWKLLERTFDDGAIPAIGDENSLQWILKKPVGDDLEMPGEDGKPVKLRIVAALHGSMFQGQLLISQARFVRAFPDRAGARFFLFEPKSGDDNAIGNQTAELSKMLSRDLSGYGVDVETPAARIASLALVERTYMAAFQSLGAFGLILGTVGLGAVLARNIFERKGELGLLQAVGYRRPLVGWLVLAEGLAILVAGLAIGSIAAVVAVGQMVFQRGQFPWLTVGGLVAAVLATGIFSGLAALGLSFRGTVVELLRSSE